MKRFQKLFDIFSENNKKLYFVGGCVRDMLLNKVPNDFDFTTNAKPEETKDILIKANFKPWPLGEKFGTIAVDFNNNNNNNNIEITTHRCDMTSGRHPTVSFTDDLKIDLARRDFTINSIAIDIYGNVYDFFNGIDDIKNKIIRTTGNANLRFSEDPLRMLRACRFISQFGFDLCNNTKSSMYKNSQLILQVSKERYFNEMTKLLLGDFVHKGLDTLCESNILYFIIPEIRSIVIEKNIGSKDIWDHTKNVIKQSPKKINVRWAALLHDIAKPHTYKKIDGKIHFLCHDLLGYEISCSITKRLKMPKKTIDSISNLVLFHLRPSSLITKQDNKYIVSKKALRRLVNDCENKCNINDLIDLFESDVLPHKLEKMKCQANSIRNKIKLMDDDDLRPKLPTGIGKLIIKKFNLKPGPKVKEIKNLLEKMLLDGVININFSPNEMLDFLKKEKLK